MFWMDGFHQGQGTKEDKSGFGKNKSIECIRRVLDRMRAKGSLPTDVHQRVLYLQCDNKEKTWTLLAYLGDLVRAGMFTEAHANMLIVGHTHEDIDQFFSRLSIFLARNAGRTSDNGTIDKFFGQLHKYEDWRSRNRGLVTAICDYFAKALPPGIKCEGIDTARAFMAYKDANGIVQYKYRGKIAQLGASSGTDCAQCLELNEDFETWFPFRMRLDTAAQTWTTWTTLMKFPSCATPSVVGTFTSYTSKTRNA